MEIQRNAYLQTIRERLQTYPVVSSLGPRQAGKTTLARMLAAESAGAVHLFDLESPVDLTRLSNPELVLRSLEGLIVLDEVQRRPDLFPLLRVLAGRVSFVDVTGFSLSELGASSLSRLWWRGGTRPATTCHDQIHADSPAGPVARASLHRPSGGAELSTGRVDHSHAATGAAADSPHRRRPIETPDGFRRPRVHICRSLTAPNLKQAG